MCAGFNIRIGNIEFRTSEALYQACRFPDHPDIQADIIAQKSPMSAKMKTKPVIELTRPDWMNHRYDIMHWAVRLKLQQNWEKFGELFDESGSMPIVEQSRKDAYWGAIKDESDGHLVGENRLGHILMTVRYDRANSPNRIIPAPKIDNFKILGIAIG